MIPRVSITLVTLYGLSAFLARHTGVEYCLSGIRQSRAPQRINDSAPHFFYNHPSGVREQSADNAPYQKPMQPTLHPDQKRTWKRHPFTERIRAVELHKQGRGSKWIAAELGVDDSQVRSWIRKYKEHGVESLHPYSRPDNTSASKGLSLYGQNERKFKEAYKAYAETRDTMASITRRYGLNYSSFRYHLLRYHPELQEKRQKLRRPIHHEPTNQI